MARDLGNLTALTSECVPILEPGAGVVLAVTAADAAGGVVTVQIAIPANGVQSLRRNLRVALQALPLELRQENN